jgi:hypothetical protein
LLYLNWSKKIRQKQFTHTKQHSGSGSPQLAAVHSSQSDLYSPPPFSHTYSTPKILNLDVPVSTPAKVVLRLFFPVLAPIRPVMQRPPACSATSSSSSVMPIGRAASPLPASMIPESRGHSLFSKLSTPQQLSKHSKHYSVSLSTTASPLIQNQKFWPNQ